MPPPDVVLPPRMPPTGGRAAAPGAGRTRGSIEAARALLAAPAPTLPKARAYKALQRPPAHHRRKRCGDCHKQRNTGGRSYHPLSPTSCECIWQDSLLRIPSVIFVDFCAPLQPTEAQKASLRHTRATSTSQPFMQRRPPPPPSRSLSAVCAVHSVRYNERGGEGRGGEGEGRGEGKGKQTRSGSLSQTGHTCNVVKAAAENRACKNTLSGLSLLNTLGPVRA